jgi:hypothetical protein
MTAGLFLAALRHDRAVVLGSLALVVLLAWTYLLLGGGVGMEMTDMGGGQMMAMPPEWTLGYGLVVFVMWAVMMLAMMLPSAAPVTLLIASLARKRAAGGGAVRASTAVEEAGFELMVPRDQRCSKASTVAPAIRLARGMVSRASCRRGREPQAQIRSRYCLLRGRLPSALPPSRHIVRLFTAAGMPMAIG